MADALPTVVKHYKAWKRAHRLFLRSLVKARRQGHSWHRIAAALGMSPQGARRFSLTEAYEEAEDHLELSGRA